MYCDQYPACRGGWGCDECTRLAHYRWWTMGAGRDYVKVGPLSVCTFVLGDHRWVSVVWRCRYVREWPLWRVA